MEHVLSDDKALSGKICSLEDEEYKSLQKLVCATRNGAFHEYFLDMLLANHREFEKEIFSLSLEIASRQVHDNLWFRQNDIEINRLLCNYFTTVRTYLDLAPRLLKEVEEDLFKAFEGASAKEYDSHFNYRIADSLRNYGQHLGFVLTGIEYSFNAEEGGKSVRAVPNIKRSELRKMVKRKPVILNEIDKMSNNYNLVRMIRSYTTSIYTIHNVTRKKIRPTVEDAWKKLVEVMEEKGVPEDKFKACSLLDVEDGKVFEAKSVSRDMEKMYDKMRKTNNSVNFRKLRLVVEAG